MTWVIQGQYRGRLSKRAEEQKWQVKGIKNNRNIRKCRKRERHEEKQEHEKNENRWINRKTQGECWEVWHIDK